VIAVVLVALIAARTPHHGPRATHPEKPVQVERTQHFVIDGVDVDVRMPPGVVRGTVLVLPGWDSTRQDWCTHGLDVIADERGYMLVMPEMGKSVYSWGFFPETKAKVRKFPDRKKLVERVIPELQTKHSWLRQGERNFVLGRSTGGRGALLLALDRPYWFHAVASLSGDFDQTAMPNDGLMSSAYGPFAQQGERWRTVDNPMHDAAKLSVPVYLGHGLKDRIVPPEQTRSFAHALDVQNPALRKVVHLDESGAHDHAYWQRELAAVFDFFDATP
jgi:S-formylglutathione hydrolase FrmB